MTPHIFSRSLLAAATLAALGAQTALAADFTGDAYSNADRQDAYERFTVANADFGDAAAVALGETGALTVSKDFIVDVTRTTLVAGPLAGVGAYEGATLTLTGDATVSVRNLTEIPAEGAAARAKAPDTFGVVASKSTVRTAGLKIAAEGPLAVTGLHVDAASVTVGDLSVSARSRGGAATGIRVEGRPAGGGDALTASGAARITAEGAVARGLTVSNAIANFDRDFSAAVSGETEAVGIHAEEGLAYFSGHAVVSASVAGEGAARAVVAQNKGEVLFLKGATIESDGYALYAAKDSVISLYGSRDAVSRIVGDVSAAANDSVLNIELVGGDVMTGAAGGAGVINLGLSDDACWNVSGKSSVTELGTDGGRLVFASGADALEVRGDWLMEGKSLPTVVMSALPAAGGGYISVGGDIYGERDSEVGIRAVMTGDFNDARTGSAADAVRDAADAVFGKDSDKGAAVTEVNLEEGRLEGAVSATRNDDGSFTVVQRANAKTEAMKTLAVLSAVQWRHELNDLTKRMGELRSSPEGVGGWARVYGSELSRGGITARNASVQAGADADVGAGWKAGAAFTYTDGTADMATGGADAEAFGLAAYGTWLGDSGRFLDLIARVSRLENDFDVNGVTGEIENTALSLSAEYGRRLEFAGGAFVEPQVEVTWGRIFGDDFVNSEGVRIEQDDFDSLIGRLGARAGFSFPNDAGLVYARASVLHDFMGESDAVARLGAKRVRLSDDIGGTWGEFGIGANFRLSPATGAYVDLERTTGGEVTEKWRWNVGVRHAF